MVLTAPTEPAHPLAVANALDAASEDMQEELASDRIFSDKERVGLPPGELVDLPREGIEEGTFCEQSNPEPLARLLAVPLLTARPLLAPLCLNPLCPASCLLQTSARMIGATPRSSWGR